MRWMAIRATLMAKAIRWRWPCNGRRPSSIVRCICVNADAQRLRASRPALSGVGSAGVRGALITAGAQPDPNGGIAAGRQDGGRRLALPGLRRHPSRVPQAGAAGQRSLGGQGHGDGKTVGFHLSSSYSPWLSPGRDRPGAPHAAKDDPVRLKVCEHQTGRDLEDWEGET